MKKIITLISVVLFSVTLSTAALAMSLENYRNIISYEIDTPTILFDRVQIKVTEVCRDGETLRPIDPKVRVLSNSDSPQLEIVTLAPISIIGTKEVCIDGKCNRTRIVPARIPLSYDINVYKKSNSEDNRQRHLLEKTIPFNNTFANLVPPNGRAG